MKNYKLLPSYRMTAAEITEYNALPDNLPETKLSVKQKEFVSDLYSKYIGRPIDVQSYYKPMYEREQSDGPWPSGPRLKKHEAQRIILNNLVFCQSRKTLTHSAAASWFHSALTCRRGYAELIAKIYSNH